MVEITRATGESELAVSVSSVIEVAAADVEGLVMPQVLELDAEGLLPKITVAELATEPGEFPPIYKKVDVGGFKLAEADHQYVGTYWAVLLTANGIHRARGELACEPGQVGTQYIFKETTPFIPPSARDDDYSKRKTRQLWLGYGSEAAKAIDRLKTANS